MNSNRRELLTRMAASGLALQSLANEADAFRGKIRAVAFDAFPIPDSRPVFALVDELYPKKGVELSALWRDRQFEYAWLRTISQRYLDFWQVTDDALIFAAKALRVELTPEKHARLMEAYIGLRCWPDVPDALRSLKKAGIRLAFLSNMTAGMLEAGIRNSQLESLFDHVLSTDRVKAYKPDPRAYQMGLDAFGLKRDQILFAATLMSANTPALGSPVRCAFPGTNLARPAQPVQSSALQGHRGATSGVWAFPARRIVSRSAVIQALCAL
jgi:2-haloacid dehalogenase